MLTFSTALCKEKFARTLSASPITTSKSKLPRSQDEYFSDDTVKGFFEAKSLAGIAEMQAQVIIDTLKDLGKLNGNKKLGTLLDVGCGYGVSTLLMAKHFDHAIGIDLSENQIKKAREIRHPDHAAFQIGNAENTPIANSSVDVITGIFSIQHFDLEKFLPECRRVLKPGGVAIFYTEFLSMVTSLESDELPSIVDEIKEMRESLLTSVRASNHPDHLLWDDFQVLFDLIDWPGKSKITREAYTVSKLTAIRDAYLSVPAILNMGTTSSNPVIKAFQQMARAWQLQGDQEMKVRATWNTNVLVLG